MDFQAHMERRAGCFDEEFEKSERDTDFEYDRMVDRKLEEE